MADRGGQMNTLRIVFLSFLVWAALGEAAPGVPARVAQEEPPGARTVTVEPGSNVQVQPIGEVTITFPQVLERGGVSFRLLFEGPEGPKDYLVSSPPVYLDLSTTARFQPPGEICVHYSPDLFPAQGSDLRLLLREGQSWMDETRTLNRQEHRVCGRFHRLGLFLLAVRSVDGLYEELALAVRTIPAEATREELAVPLVLSRRALQGGDLQEFRRQLEEARKLVSAASEETIPGQTQQWIHYFLGRIESRAVPSEP